MINMDILQTLKTRLAGKQVSVAELNGRGSGSLDAHTFYTVTGCIYNGCGSTKFLEGPHGGGAINICCAKCGAKYNDTGMGIHSLHSFYDNVANAEAVELDDTPHEEVTEESPLTSDEISGNSLLL